MSMWGKLIFPSYISRGTYIVSGHSSLEAKVYASWEEGCAARASAPRMMSWRRGLQGPRSQHRVFLGENSGILGVFYKGLSPWALYWVARSFWNRACLAWPWANPGPKRQTSRREGKESTYYVLGKAVSEFKCYWNYTALCRRGGVDLHLTAGCSEVISHHHKVERWHLTSVSLHNPRLENYSNVILGVSQIKHDGDVCIYIKMNAETPSIPLIAYVSISQSHKEIPDSSDPNPFGLSHL